MTENTTKVRKKLNALDIFIILAVIMCITAVGIRIYMGDKGDIPGKASVEIEDYIVSFLVLNIRETSADSFVDGDTFIVPPNGEVFGKLINTPSFTPAEMYIENDEGQYILTYSTQEGDDARIDVRGTFLVSGSMTEEGFLLNGKTYIAPNKTITIQGKINVNITVTDITKAT